MLWRASGIWCLCRPEVRNDLKNEYCQVASGNVFWIDYLLCPCSINEQSYHNFISILPEYGVWAISQVHFPNIEERSPRECRLWRGICIYQIPCYSYLCQAYRNPLYSYCFKQASLSSSLLKVPRRHHVEVEACRLPPPPLFAIQNQTHHKISGKDSLRTLRLHFLIYHKQKQV
jgi:hypothetical protein